MKGFERLDNSYYIRNAQAIYTSYMHDGMAMGVGFVQDLEYNRKYAAGWIDVEKIKPSKDNKTSQAKWEQDLSNKISRESSRDMKEGWNNIDWHAYQSPAEKLLDVVEDQILSVDFNISAEVLDPISKDEELDKKWSSKVHAKFADLRQRVADFSGTPIEDNMFLPESNEELEMIALAGGFKHRHATATQNILKGTFENSGWSSDRERWVSDVLCSKYIAAMTTVDSNTGQVVVEYVDPANVSLQYSEYPDHRDSEFGFVWSTKTISELLHMGIPYEQLEDAIRIWGGRLGNPTVGVDQPIDKTTALGSKVQVVRCFWIDSEFGTRRVYETTWVINTAVCYNSGISQTQGRHTNNLDVYVPLILIKRTKRPLMDRMRDWIDMFYVGVKKLELANKMGRPNGMAINLHQLNNTSAGMNGKPMEFLKMLADTRFLPFMQSVSGAYQGGAVSPVTPISGDVGTVFENAIIVMQQAIAGLYEVTGLNPQIFSAMLQVGSRTATEANYQVAQANAVIRPYIYIMQLLKERTATVVKSRIRTQAKDRAAFKNTYQYVISTGDIDALCTEAERDGECKLRMVVRPTEEFRREMKAQSHEAVVAGVLQYDDYLYINELLNQGVDISLIRTFIAYKIKRAKQEKQQNDIALQQAQAKANAEYSQIQQQGALQAVQQEGQIKGTVEAMKQDAQLQREVTLAGENRKTKGFEALLRLAELAGNEEKITTAMGGGIANGNA